MFLLLAEGSARSREDLWIVSLCCQMLRVLNSFMHMVRHLNQILRCLSMWMLKIPWHFFFKWVGDNPCVLANSFLYSVKQMILMPKALWEVLLSA